MLITIFIIYPIFDDLFVHPVLQTNKHSDGVHVGITPVDQKKHVQDIMKRIPTGLSLYTFTHI